MQRLEKVLQDAGAVEVTHGVAGFHPHLHVMVCFDTPMSQELLEELAGPELGTELSHALLARSGGNPFFLEELVTLLADAGMVGADGLGKEVTAAIATLDVAKGVEAGLAVVVLAIFLDRLTAALGDKSLRGKSIFHLVNSRRAAKAA